MAAVLTMSAHVTAGAHAEDGQPHEHGAGIEEQGLGRADAAGLQDRETHQTLLTTDESDCREISIGRAGNAAAVRAAVPDRYSTTGVLQFIDYTCVISVDGQRRARRATVHLGMARIDARDGVAGSGNYLLWVATDEQLLAVRFRQLGLPVRDGITATTTAELLSDGRTSYAFEVAGEGVDHSLKATAGTPSAQPSPPTPFTVYYDSPLGDLRLRYLSDLRAADALVAGDLRGVVPLMPLLLRPTLAQLVGTSTFTLAYAEGRQTSRLERLP